MATIRLAPPARPAPGTGRRSHAARAPGRRCARAVAGFTLIELLIAIGVLALMAGLTWRGLDAMVRTQAQTQEHTDAVLALQAGLAQWSTDLDALLELPQTPALDWDGRGLRLTRRSSTAPGDGVLVVAWTRRNVDGRGLWLRWQSPPVRTRGELQSAWTQAARWAQNPGDEEKRYEVPVTALDDWQIFFFRGDAWSNPLSSDGGTAPATGSGASPGAGLRPPDGIRLVLALPPGAGISGTLTRDWMRATLGGGKS